MMRIAGRAFAGLVALVLVAPAFADDRSADEILKDIQALKPPATDAILKATGNERQKLIQAYMADMQKLNSRRAELIGELLKADPKNPQLATMLPQRWMILAQTDKADEALKEITEVSSKTDDAKLKTEGLFAKAQIQLIKGGGDVAAAMPAIDEFVAAAPKDRRAEQLLYMASDSTEDEAKKTALEDRILKEFPEGRFAGMVKGARKKREAIGKPFELEFTDAIKDTNVSMKDLKGKVVVVDFWATWCGPCVAEMPNMKKLYAEYKDKGVEFIGVSLDQPKEKGGLDKLKEFVAKNDIQWPQYYQGNFWQSEFSSGWGINSIPAVFVVDPDGNLYSVEARGKLEKMIPELLKKAKAGAGAGGQ